MTQPPSNDQSLALIPTDAPPKHGRGSAASPFLHRVDPDAQIRPQTLDDIIGQASL